MATKNEDRYISICQTIECLPLEIQGRILHPITLDIRMRNLRNFITDSLDELRSLYNSKDMHRFCEILYLHSSKYFTTITKLYLKQAITDDQFVKYLRLLGFFNFVGENTLEVALETSQHIASDECRINLFERIGEKCTENELRHEAFEKVVPGGCSESFAEGQLRDWICCWLDGHVNINHPLFHDWMQRGGKYYVESDED